MDKRFVIFVMIFFSSNVFALKVAVTKDVLKDYKTFASTYKVGNLKSFKSPVSRRDVVEIALFLEALHIANFDEPIQFVVIDSYKRILKELNLGRVDATANTVWNNDATKGIWTSLPVIEEGQFNVGIYTALTNKKALEAKSVSDIISKSFVSSKHWTNDWLTLKSLKVKSVFHTVKWSSMVNMVGKNRIDYLLAPFPNSESLKLHAGKFTLYPVPNFTVSIRGSRHYALSKSSKKYKTVSKALNKGLIELKKRGLIRQALIESGFINKRTELWRKI